jgi:hypothetical protein
MGFRLGVAGFLLFFLLLPLSAQVSFLPSFGNEPSQLSQPEKPETEPGASLIDRLVAQLEAWVNWYEMTWTPWSQADRKWHEAVKVSLTQAAILLQKQSERAEKAENEVAALRLEIERLKRDRLVIGAISAGAGSTLGAILSAIIEQAIRH